MYNFVTTPDLSDVKQDDVRLTIDLIIPNYNRRQSYLMPFLAANFGASDALVHQKYSTYLHILLINVKYLFNLDNITDIRNYLETLQENGSDCQYYIMPFRWHWYDIAVQRYVIA